jgi:acyl-CoA synthetase (AMP-forming)/AMP-acid ligase II
MLLPDLIDNAAQKFPQKTAVAFPGEQISFGEIDRRANQVAARLRRLGITRGHRVALLFESSPSALVYFWGIMKSGAETVDIPHHAGPEMIREVLEECRPSAAAIDPRQLARLGEEGGRALPRVLLSTRDAKHQETSERREVHALEDIVAEERAEWTRPDSSPHDVALTVYTSGTTGRPKGVMLSHDNLISNITAANSVLGLTSADSILVVVPLYFIHGRMQILTHALIGGTVYISAGFQFPRQVLEELVRYEVTGFSGVPYHFSTLLERANLRATKLPSLRYALVTGGALSPTSLRALAAAIPNVELHSAYGTTEASPRITYLGPKEILRHPDSAGRSLPGITVEIVGDDGTSLPQGAVGEVVACGPNVMKGYVSGDHVSSGRIDDKGRLHTGDLGRLDHDGFLYLVGRKSDMIKSAGERIFPREIEDVINKHPDVRECAVLGVKDEVLGERLVALVVPKSEPFDPASLRTHCLRWLPFVRTPREIHFVAELPKTASTKINRAALPDLLRSAAR